MSSTKTNTSRTGPGPSKFRKDAAIFSPSNFVHPNTNYVPPPPITPNMQMNMNPMMMNMMNPQMGGVPPLPDAYYQSYNPYAYPQYEYNPYNPPMYQPNGYQYMPQMYGQVPMMMDGRQMKRKSFKSQLSTPRSQSIQSDSSPVSTDPSKDRPVDNIPDTAESEPFVEDLVEVKADTPDQSSETTEISKDSVPKAASSDSTPTSTTATDSITADTTTTEEPVSVILKNLPLYINTNYKEFQQDQSTSRRKELFQSKSTLQDKDLIIRKPSNDFVDFNKVIEQPNTSKGKIDWAAVVSSSVSKESKKDVTSTKEPAPSSTQSVAPTPQIKTIKEIDSVGLISLKSMFNILGDSDDYFKIQSRGLTNSGNICYMNSILQVLIYCEPFNKLLRSIEQKSVGSLNESKTPLIDAVISLFKDFNMSGTKSLSPESFYTKISKNSKFNHLRWGQQEDAEEFLGYLLDGLHEEFVKSISEISNEQINLLLEKTENTETKLQIKSAMKIVKKLNNNDQGNDNDKANASINNDNHDSNDDNDDNEGWNEIGGGKKKVSSKRTVEIEPSPIKTIFGGQFRSVLQVPHKKDQSITLDPYQCIQLDIKDDTINTIEEAFKHLNEPEQIPFKLNDNKEVVAKKQTFIDSLPEVLIIHLKRFSFEQLNNGNIEKLRKKIEYGHKLAIPNELFSNWRKNINRDYQLIGVVYHHGVSAEGGHYTCDVLKQPSLTDTNHWIRIDDTLINKISKDDVLNGDDDIKNAYILFYQKL